jgi:23S rRNA (adenine2503-C2)-methyltransferase
MTPPLHLLNSSRAELTRHLAEWGFAPVHALRLWRYLYRELATDVAAMTELPRRLRERLIAHSEASGGSHAPVSPAEASSFPHWNPAATTESDNGATAKYLFALGEGAQVETVLMRYAHRTTACLSTQAGCAMGCVFCATGQAGFMRNLSPAEIVGQAMFAERVLRSGAPGLSGSGCAGGAARRRSAELDNLVFMGMGEPLANYDAVMTAIDIVGDPAGLAIGAKQTTVSTVGVVPGIVRLADERRNCSLAVSLHAATQQERAAIVPVARAWPLAELMEACRYYATKLDRRIFFEWTLLAGRNDGEEQARQLVELLAGIPSQVNLIPLNTTAGYDGTASSDDAARRFQSRLREAGLPTTIRTRRGVEAASGCGQLAGEVVASTRSNTTRIPYEARP